MLRLFDGGSKLTGLLPISQWRRAVGVLGAAANLLAAAAGLDLWSSFAHLEDAVYRNVGIGFGFAARPVHVNFDCTIEGSEAKEKGVGGI